MPHSWSERGCACAAHKTCPRSGGTCPQCPPSLLALRDTHWAGAVSAVRLSPQKKHLKKRALPVRRAAGAGTVGRTSKSAAQRGRTHHRLGGWKGTPYG